MMAAIATFPGQLARTTWAAECNDHREAARGVAWTTCRNDSNRSVVELFLPEARAAMWSWAMVSR